MRSERQMFDFILECARADERVRAVTLEGSRTNPNAPKDLFQDYDISFHVTDMQSYIRDPGWVDRFGERIIMQMPEAMAMFPPDIGNRFSYMMLFTDGNRIDLTLIPIEEKDTYRNEDKLMMVLLDKDNAFPDVPPPTDENYWAKRPSAAFFADCCNEFWWVSTYVAKGLWRKEILFAIDHLNQYMRPMLMKMLEWKVGTETDYAVSIGKNGKYLERYVPADRWTELLATFPNGSYADTWRALFAMGDLFRATAIEVAERLEFAYPVEDDRRVTAYLKQVHVLPPDAVEFR